MLSGLANNIHLFTSLSAFLFAMGLLTVLTRKNGIGLFMGVELMLNAAALNFVVFQSLKNQVSTSSMVDGHLFSLIIIVMAAVEAAVALAIVLRVFAVNKNIDPDKAAQLRG